MSISDSISPFPYVGATEAAEMQDQEGVLSASACPRLGQTVSRTERPSRRHSVGARLSSFAGSNADWSDRDVEERASRLWTSMPDVGRGGLLNSKTSQAWTYERTC